MTPQFTPGPWRAVLRGQLSYVAGPDGFIAQMLGTEGQRGDARAEANASLTAAAPEMFEALVDLSAAFEVLWKTEGLNPKDNETLKAAKAALAKAQGVRT